MTWMEIALAISPAMRTSARRTDPQVYPSANRWHSATADPPPSMTGGKCSRGNTEAVSRSPNEAESRSTWSTCWHVDALPGSHTVTVTKGTLRSLLTCPVAIGPESTTIGRTLWASDTG